MPILMSILLSACAGSPISNLAKGMRNQTHSDMMNSWVGENEEKLIAKWGPPSKSYTLASGAKIIAYDDEWDPCVEKFKIEHSKITQWGSSDCKYSQSSWGQLPKDTPIPKPTL